MIRAALALGTLSIAVASFAGPAISTGSKDDAARSNGSNTTNRGSAGKVGAASPAAAAASKEQYTATLHFRIEDSPRLLPRAQQLVRHELEKTFRAWPALEVKRFELQSSGNQVYLSIVSDKDIQRPVQEAVAAVVTNLDGKVWAQGRSDIHRTSLYQPVEAFLDIQLAEVQTEVKDLSQVRVERISAIAIPVRELVRELKFRIQQRYPKLPVFGHSIDRSCAERDLDLSLGETPDESPKALKEVMEELAAVLNVPGGVKQINGRYVFAGACHPQEIPVRRRIPGPPPPGFNGASGDMQPSNVSFSAEGFSVQSVIPLMPLGQW